MFCRRKLNVRGSIGTEPIIIDTELISMLERYVAIKNEEISCIILKYLNLLLTTSSLLEPHEVDNVILRNSVALYNWYD